MIEEEDKYMHVGLKKMKMVSEDFIDQARKITYEIERIGSVIASLSMLSDTDEVVRTLKNIQNNLERNRGRLLKAGYVLEDITNVYENTEEMCEDRAETGSYSSKRKDAAESGVWNIAQMPVYENVQNVLR